MKSFDLNAMGVQEMNAQEAKELNGGSIIALAVFSLLIGFGVGFAVATADKPHITTYEQN